MLEHRNRDVGDIGDEDLGKVQGVSKVSEGTGSIHLVERTAFHLYDLRTYSGRFLRILNGHDDHAIFFKSVPRSMFFPNIPQLSR